ncbi:hypothetical protein [Pseudalkalibacillus berkeleyi]|uniref:DUF3298 domain-containing protein n=1 Tax=Pseudalkalibacillus berkeleyi TaxID=1069813 RepID=A0ABS9H4P3_9BACL|nr:hypothetical protein [Pseudalkalibacillus berkeleyi]MCF6138802.1 hypothetical protein [Pseudalkalibacillus berkeleyi]
MKKRLMILFYFMAIFLSIGGVALSNSMLLKEEKNVDLNYKDVTVELKDLGNDKYLVTMRVDWKKIPEIREKDILAIGLQDTNNDFTILLNTIMGKQHYTLSNGKEKKSETITYSFNDGQQYFTKAEGVGHLQNLKDDEGDFKVTKLLQELEFIMDVNDSSETSEIKVEAISHHMYNYKRSISDADFNIRYNLGEAMVVFDDAKDLGAYGIPKKVIGEIPIPKSRLD